MGTTHLWAQDLPALRWDHDIQGALAPRGVRWSRGAPGGLGARLDQADPRIPALKASSGEQLTVQFVLWGGKKSASIYSKRISRTVLHGT